MKFVMSYSCGKDSTLALDKLIKSGHEPAGLLVMVNKELGRSWFHGAENQLLDKISDALKIPLLRCPSDGEGYAKAFEEGLRIARESGADLAGFGDIDVEEHRSWCEERCAAAGVKPVFPLWQQERVAVVRQVLSDGYRCIIKSIDNRLLPRDLLGRELDADVLSVMSEKGVDLCGENGEYHTIVVDGPIFKRRLDVRLGDCLDFGERSVIDIL